MEPTQNTGTTTRSKPPAGTRWIIRRADLPKPRDPQAYLVQPETGEPFQVTLAKRQRQVIEALRSSPIFCASPVRLSDVVCTVKGEHNLDIETILCKDPDDPDGTVFGYYSLRDKLTPVSGTEAAA